MNDEELDLMLDAWTLAPPSPSLRERVRVGFPGMPWRERLLRFVPVGIGKFVFGGSVVAACLLLVVALGFSQPSKTVASLAGIPFTVDSESTSYENGSPRTLDITSYEFRGNMAILAESQPGHPFWTMTRHAIDAFGLIVVQVAPSLVAQPETESAKLRRADFVRAGCVRRGDTVVGNETIANYRTVQVFRKMPPIFGAGAKAVRLTEWRAPDLSCFRLAYIAENEFADGTIRLRSQERALRVNWNR